MIIQRVDKTRVVIAKGETLDVMSQVKIGRANGLQVMHVHVVLLEALAGGNVEVAGHLVHLHKAVEAASLAGLCLELVRVALTITLYHKPHRLSTGETG